MHLARLEAQVVFRRLAERFEALEPAGEAVRAVSTLSTYAEVPVRGRARARDS
jgi:cytochrome P450